MQTFRSKMSLFVMTASMLLSGCVSTLVHDDVKRTTGIDGHCSGSQWVDDSSIAVLPVPVVAFPIIISTAPHMEYKVMSWRCDTYSPQRGGFNDALCRD